MSAAPEDRTPLQTLRDRLAELADLGSIEMLLEWDQLVMMPRRAAESRAHQLATLARGIAHERATAVEIGEWLERRSTTAQLKEIDRDMVRLARRDWERARKIPASSPRRAHARRRGSGALAAGASADDFAMFAPALSATSSLRESTRECRRRPGRAHMRRCSATTTSGCARTSCEALRRAGEELPPLVDERERRSRARSSPCQSTRSSAAVTATCAARRRGRELASGRLRASLHGRDRPRDSRVTTRYGDGEVESLLSSLHEYGHALYERQVDPALARTNWGMEHRCRSTSRRASCGRTTSRAARRSRR